MLRKTTAAVVLAGALALGTASATSLGDFDDVAFAASSVDLEDCNLGTNLDLVDLLPGVPAVGDPLDYAGETFALTTLDLSVLSGLTDACKDGTVVDVVLLDSAGVVLDSIEVDPNAADLSSVSPGKLIDIVEVADIRAVLRDA